MADTDNSFDFGIFSQDQVFRAKDVQKMFENMLKLNKDASETEEMRFEIERKRRLMLKEGINVLMDEEKIRRKIYDVDVLEEGVLKSSMKIVKNTFDLTMDSYKAHELLRARKGDLKALEDQLSKMEKTKGERNLEFEKHLKRTIRDEMFSVKVQELKGQAMLNAHPLGPKVAGFLASRSGMLLMQFAGTLISIFSKMFNALVSLGKGIFRTLLDTLTGAWNMWLKIQSITGNIAADLGQTEYQTQQINNNIAFIGLAAAQWGVSIEEALGFMTSFSNITGRNRVLLQQEVNDLSAIAKATGLGAQATGEMYANMELLGYSTSQFRDYVESTRQQAGMLGLNITKVLTTVKDLLPAYNQLNFKDGIKGLTDLVMKAQGLRFELTNMRSLAVQVFNPEGAVELAAKLRVLGGDFAQMADTFGLMLKGQTDAAGLMDDVINTISRLAIKNKDGFFSIPPVQQALIREFAAATGESAENLTRAALQGAKQNDVMMQLQARGIFNKEDLLAVANLAEWDEKRGEYMIKVDVAGTKKAISEINKSMNIAQQLHGFVREEQQVAVTRMNLIEQLRNLYNMFLFSLQPLFRPIEALFKDSRFMMQLQATMKDLGEFIASKLVPIFASKGGVYEWLLDVGKTLKNIVSEVAMVLKGEGSLFKVLGKFAMDLVIKIWNAIAPKIKALLEPVKDKIKTGAGLAGAAAGALGGAKIGAMIGTAFAPGIGTAIGTGVGALVGGVGGYFAGRGVAKSMVGDAAIVGGRAYEFDKGDLTMFGGTNMIPSKNAVPTVASRDILSQVKRYDMSKAASFGTYGAKAAGEQKITVDITGTLEVTNKQNGEKVYLSRADLSDIGKKRIEEVARAIASAGKRQNNQWGGKILASDEHIKSI